MKRPTAPMFCVCLTIAALLSACGGGSGGGLDGGGAGDGGTALNCDGICSAVIIGCKMQGTKTQCIQACETSMSDQRTNCVDLYEKTARCFLDNKGQFECDERGAVIMPSACQPAQTAYLDACYH